MKKSALFLLVLFLIPTILAIETTLKENYQPRETLIAEISGNFIDNIKAEDILFYSGRAFIPVIYDLAKIQDNYYLYAVLPNKERNYTLIIKNTRYLEAGEEKQEDLKFNFTVSGNASLYTPNPGFIIANKDFNIKVESNIKTINLQTSFLNSTQEFEIKPGITKKIPFSISEINQFIITSIILTAENLEYEIPVAIFPPGTSEKSEISENLRFSKSYLNFTILKNQEFEFEISLLNTGQEDIENIEFNYQDIEDTISVKPESLQVLEAGESEKVRITIHSDALGTTQGFLTATSENYTATFYLNLLTTEDKVIYKFCEDDEECDGETKITTDGLCCIGKCKKESSEGMGKTIALIVILIILIIVVIFIIKKLKTRKKTTKEVLKEKSKIYEERFKPKPREIKGSLSRT